MLDFMPLPLFADIINIVMIIVVILFSLLGQLFKEKPQQKAKAKKRVRAAGNKNPNGGLEGEIEDFIRQVTNPNANREVEVLEAEIIDAQALPPRPTRPKERSRQPLTAADRQRQAHSNFDSGGSVGEHVRDHIDAGGVDERQTLAQQIESRDEAMETHLAEVFDHKLGILSNTTRLSDEDSISSKSSKTTTVQHEVMGVPLDVLFNSPEDVRKAVIMNEILRRPDERWQETF